VLTATLSEFVQADAYSLTARTNRPGVCLRGMLVLHAMVASVPQAAWQGSGTS
jgi:hypothetical protein